MDPVEDGEVLQWVEVMDPDLRWVMEVIMDLMVVLG